MNNSSQGKVGIYVATSLVVGNMIGSGIFLLPSTLAKYGGISIYGWLISGLGAMTLALVFSRLSKLIPKTGGPYAYTRAGFGKFAGFLIAWGYWISVLCTNAAIAVAFSGYLTIFIPELSQSDLALALSSVIAVWLLTLINLGGIRSGGNVQLITTILKVLPLVLLSIVGLFFLDTNHFIPWNRSGESDLIAIGSSLTLTLFALLGMECATIPAGNIKNPSITIPRATLLGTALTVIIYLMSSVSIMGLVAPEVLQQSKAPFADAANLLWGPTGKYLIGIGALISTFGALNGWIIVQAQIPYAVAMDKLFPPFFGQLNKRGVPGIAMLVSSAIVSLIVLSNYAKGLVDMFTFLILMGTFLVLLPYLFSSLAELAILIRKRPENWRKRLIRPMLISIPAFLFSFWAIIGAGQQVVFYGFLSLILGLPLYIWTMFKRS